MDLGYDGRLFVLAFDHRGSFKEKMFGIVDREPDASELERLRAAKQLVFDGFLAAHEQGTPAGAGILVDEEMGSAIARSAAERGIPFAMPVEKSGQPVFDFEYGDEFGEHIAQFDPTFAKVLVRWNPADPAEIKREQGERLSRLGDWLHDGGRKYLFELLVPATEQQLVEVEGDAERFDREVRPGLMMESIIELRERQVEPDVWKIEGIDDEASCRQISALTREGGRSGVISVVLGRGADDARVDHWLRTGAGVEGYAGFAIGRSIWWDGVAAWRDGGDRDEAVAAIAAQFHRFVDVYTDAAG